MTDLGAVLVGLFALVFVVEHSYERLSEWLESDDPGPSPIDEAHQQYLDGEIDEQDSNAVWASSSTTG